MDESELARARQKVPANYLRGSDHSDMVFKLNQQLQSKHGLKTAPCEAFTADQLIQLQRTLFAAREPRLQQVYASTADNRRLGAVGHLTESLEEMERLWSKERGVLHANPGLHQIARDGKCHEVVMWWVHHLAEETRTELQKYLTLPLLAATSAPHSRIAAVQAAPQAGPEAVGAVMKSYTQGIGCAACHASGQTANNHESKEWPEELSYNATAYGAFPFWDNTGPGCTWCNPALGSGQQIRVKYSAKLNSEMLLHSSCGNMGWTGAKGAPNNTPCNHLFTAEHGAFIFTPKAPLSAVADGNFCCRTYKPNDSQFPGAVPKDWMRSMTLYHNKTGGDTVAGFSGDYYAGPTKYYWSQGALQFWYMETDKGVPVEQGEGCYQPGVEPRKACPYTLPIMLFHDYDPASFLETPHSAAEFEVPEVCKSTTVDCAAPGGDSQQGVGYHPVRSLHARMAGVGQK